MNCSHGLLFTLFDISYLVLVQLDVTMFKLEILIKTPVIKHQFCTKFMVSMTNGSFYLIVPCRKSDSFYERYSIIYTYVIIMCKIRYSILFNFSERYIVLTGYQLHKIYRCEATKLNDLMLVPPKLP